MQYFTIEEFKREYPRYANNDITNMMIVGACELIFSQIGLIYREQWNDKTVPLPIKQASMEQLRFQIEHDIPYIDIDKNITAGNMSANINTDYSTLALRILANNGYMYRGNPINTNIGLNIPFGG